MPGMPAAYLNFLCFKAELWFVKAVLKAMQTVYLSDLGVFDYGGAWEYQTALHRGLVENKLRHRDQPPASFEQRHAFLLVEHPPVYTLGKSGSAANLLLSEAECLERGIQYFPVNRGGDITFHGPGQIVGYPLLDLECFFADVHRYVRSLEEVIIRTLAEFGLEPYRIPGYTGVWVRGRPAGLTESGEFWEKQRKICAIGVHMSRWVTLHGFALNINTPLHFFDHIVPCGIEDPDKTVTSLDRETGAPVDLDEVKTRLRNHFETVFECRLLEKVR
jgi:lipoyl(octanoyl) transferase